MQLTLFGSFSILVEQNGFINISNSTAFPFFIVNISGCILNSYLSFFSLTDSWIFNSFSPLFPIHNKSLLSSFTGILSSSKLIIKTSTIF